MNQEGDLSRLCFTATTDRRPRLDVYVHECVPWRSRSQLQALIEAGLVTVNGQKSKPAQRVRRGDAIAVAIPAPPMPDLAFAPGSIPALYLDDDLVVLNKPPGILTHPIVGHQKDTLVNYVMATFGDRYGAPHSCHRLDRETSGTILMAFELTVCQLIQRQFERHRIEKTYLAIAGGRLPAAEVVVDRPIREGKDLPSCIAGPRLRPSTTVFRLIAAGAEASLVEAVPVSGRQNQIRIHAAATGFPLAGDARFGGPPPPPTAPHFLLHARRIRFYHPGQKLAADIEAPLSAPFAAALEHYGLPQP